MGSGNGESSKELNRSYTLDIALVGAVIILVGGGSCLTYWTEYLGGRVNEPYQGFIIGFGLMLPMVLMTLIVGISEFVRLFPWPSTFRHQLLRLTFLLLPSVVFFASFATTTPLAPIFLAGFEQWTAQEVDIDAIQQWLSTEDPQLEGRSDSARELTAKELPSCVAALAPLNVSFRNAGPQGETTVELLWPSGFSDVHGLIVGPRTMETPEAGMIKLPDGRNEFRRPIRPGVYVFSRG